MLDKGTPPDQTEQVAGHSFELGGDKPLLPSVAPVDALRASNSYYEWVAAGKPLTPALPVREIVNKLKAAFPKAAEKNLFSWYANDAHYQAVPPQDHTPYSATGWPGTSPRWYVFATDVMHRPDLGVDCNVLFEYWLAEAKAGHTPWIKYIIWQSKLYDVRSNWAPQANSDHFDHIHLSMRTDWVNKSTGAWSVTPQKGLVMAVIVMWPPEVPGKLYFSNGSGMHHIPSTFELGQIQRGWPGIQTVDATKWPAGVVHQLYGPEGAPWGAPPEPAPPADAAAMTAIATRVARETVAATTLTPPGKTAGAVASVE